MQLRPHANFKSFFMLTLVTSPIELISIISHLHANTFYRRAIESSCVEPLNFMNIIFLLKKFKQPLNTTKPSKFEMVAPAMQSLEKVSAMKVEFTAQKR